MISIQFEKADLGLYTANQNDIRFLRQRQVRVKIELHSFLTNDGHNIAARFLADAWISQSFAGQRGRKFYFKHIQAFSDH